jgi:hypothetical protein
VGLEHLNVRALIGSMASLFESQGRAKGSAIAARALPPHESKRCRAQAFGNSVSSSEADSLPHAFWPLDSLTDPKLQVCSIQHKIHLYLWAVSPHYMRVRILV